MDDHGPRIDHIIIAAKDVDRAAKHIFEVRNRLNMHESFDEPHFI